MRVVLLTGTSRANAYTLERLASTKSELVGVCLANNKIAGGNVGYLKSLLRKNKYLSLVGQILLKIVYPIFNKKKDTKILNDLFPQKEIENIIKEYKLDYLKCSNYNNEKTKQWIKKRDPDVIVVHTPYWVGKEIRNLVNGKVLGGHPGITPYYRGIHSAFWAVYNNELSKLGFSVFWLDNGVDTGDVIVQGRIEPNKGNIKDSYITLGWKAMKRTAEAQAKILNLLTAGKELMSFEHENIDPETNYPYPTLWQYIIYKIRQDIVR